MNLIASLFGALMSPLFTWAINLFTRKVIVLATTITAFLTITAAFIFCLKYLVGITLTLAVVPSWVSYPLGLFMPFNWVGVLSSIMSAAACRWAYDKAIDKIRLINTAT